MDFVLFCAIGGTSLVGIGPLNTVFDGFAFLVFWFVLSLMECGDYLTNPKLTKKKGQLSMSHLRSRKHTMVEDPIEFIIEDLTVATRLPF